MLIQNFGLHWKRENVVWGKPGSGNQGHLRGQLASATKSDAVDFRWQAGIYILQERFKPVYIGQVGAGDQRIFARLKQHTKNHLAERWDRFSWFGILPVKKGELDYNFNLEKMKTDVYGIIDHIEGVLIAVTEPALNRQGSRWGDAQQYRQLVEKNVVKSDYETDDYDDDDVD